MNYRATILAAGALIAAGCSGPGVPAVPPVAGTLTHATLPSEPVSAVPDGKRRQKQLLFVSEPFANTIAVYNAASKLRNPLPLRTITNGINFPAGITVDRSGNLYVANYGGNTVTVYAPNGSTPAYTLNVSSPMDVKVDGSKNVYVSSLSNEAIYLFPAGASSPSYTWNLPPWRDLGQMALLNPTQPGQTSLYITSYLNGAGAVYSCYPGNSSCVQISGYSIGNSAGLAVEQSPGGSQPFEYLVADQGLPGVDSIINGQIVNQFFTADLSPREITFNAARSALFVAEPGQVQEYSFPAANPIETFSIAGGVDSYGVATSPSGAYF